MELEADGEVIHMISDLQPGTKYMLCLIALGEFQNSIEVTHGVVTNTGKLMSCHWPTKYMLRLKALGEFQNNTEVTRRNKTKISSIVPSDSIE